MGSNSQAFRIGGVAPYKREDARVETANQRIFFFIIAFGFFFVPPAFILDSWPKDQPSSKFFSKEMNSSTLQVEQIFRTRA
jgi:hypothetical protein